MCRKTFLCPGPNGMQLSGVGPKQNVGVTEKGNYSKVILYTTNILWKAGMQNWKGKHLVAVKHKNVKKTTTTTTTKTCPCQETVLVLGAETLTVCCRHRKALTLLSVIRIRVWQQEKTESKRRRGRCVEEEETRRTNLSAKQELERCVLAISILVEAF